MQYVTFSVGLIIGGFLGIVIAFIGWLIVAPGWKGSQLIDTATKLSYPPGFLARDGDKFYEAGELKLARYAYESYVASVEHFRLYGLSIKNLSDFDTSPAFAALRVAHLFALKEEESEKSRWEQKAANLFAEVGWNIKDQTQLQAVRELYDSSDFEGLATLFSFSDDIGEIPSNLERLRHAKRVYEREKAG